MKKTCSALALLLLLAGCRPAVQPQENEAVMTEKFTDTETLATIFARKSVRSYQAGKAVEVEKIDLLLRAAMAAPTAMDRRPWEFVVLTDRAALDSLAAKLPYAKMLTQAPMAVVICGNTERSNANWFIDCSAASENLLLAAEALGLGAVWTGVYPDTARAAAVAQALNLPEHIVPLNVIPIGYPDGETKPKEKYDASKIHTDRW